MRREERLGILAMIYNDSGHKGFAPNRNMLYMRFWWPNAMNDLKWYIRTCQICQERNVQKLNIPSLIPEPVHIFGRIHIDTMFMPKHSGFSRIVHAVCSLTGWPEAKALKNENGKTLGDFIFNEILCRFGAVREIVTDNGPPFVKALDYLSKKFKINHI